MRRLFMLPSSSRVSRVTFVMRQPISVASHTCQSKLGNTRENSRFPPESRSATPAEP
jgi:hypothetical protein